MKADRKFELVLYPSSSSYDCNEVILKAQQFFDFWAYCLHDKDIDDLGEPKKAHIHFYGKKYTTITPNGVCYQLGIDISALSNIKNWRSAIRYLIHADNPEKYPYDISTVTSNFDTTSIFQAGLDDEVQAQKIYKHIIENPDHNLKEILEWVLDNNLWSGFRRGFAVWDKFIGGINYESSRNSPGRYGS